MKTTFIFTLIFSTLLMQGCETAEPDTVKNVYLISGQSFGFCAGPCVQYFSLGQQNTKTIFSVEYRNMDVLPDNVQKDGIKSYNDELTANQYDAILSAVDEQNIINLAGTYGCPDCADGGAEWIELYKNGQSYRVNFEYGKTVEGLETLINLLRTNRQKLSTKYVP